MLNNEININVIFIAIFHISLFELEKHFKTDIFLVSIPASPRLLALSTDSFMLRQRAAAGKKCEINF